MQFETTRFGLMETDDDRILTFPAGLLGFGSERRYALLQPQDDGVFLWLQSIDRPDLAFVVTDPAGWVDDYHTTIRAEQLELLGLEDPRQAQLLVIVNRYDDTLTANLQGPLVINAESRFGMQLVLADRRWTTRHELARLPAPVQAASA